MTRVQLQEDLLARWNKEDKDVPTSDIPDLKQALRPKLNQVSLEIVDALAKVLPHLSETPVQQLLRQRSTQVLSGGAISENVRNKALEAWLP